MCQLIADHVGEPKILISPQFRIYIAERYGLESTDGDNRSNSADGDPKFSEDIDSLLVYQEREKVLLRQLDNEQEVDMDMEVEVEEEEDVDESNGSDGQSDESMDKVLHLFNLREKKGSISHRIPDVSLTYPIGTPNNPTPSIEPSPPILPPSTNPTSSAQSSPSTNYPARSHVDSQTPIARPNHSKSVAKAPMHLLVPVIVEVKPRPAGLDNPTEETDKWINILVQAQGEAEEQVRLFFLWSCFAKLF
jgi:hypothetical protein